MDPRLNPTIVSAELSILGERIIHDIKTSYEESGEFIDAHLIQLNSVFGDVTEKALELLENSVFVSLKDGGKLKVFRVKGSSGTEYMVYPKLNFCECSAYKYQVCKPDPLYLMCKHVLAAHLAEVTGKFKEEFVTNSALVEMLNCSAATNFVI